jgi:hypothetical protein
VYIRDGKRDRVREMVTMALVAGIANEHQGVASSMFNAGQQAGGAAC